MSDSEATRLPWLHGAICRYILREACSLLQNNTLGAAPTAPSFNTEILMVPRTFKALRETATRL